MKNNNFKKVLIGLSGGIDSAFCLMVAADTLNPESINSLSTNNLQFIVQKAKKML